MLGISILVLIVGNPTGPGVVDSLRDGWLLSIVAFVLVALVAAPARQGGRAAGDGGGRARLAAPAAAGSTGRPRRTRPGRPPSIGLADIPLIAALSDSARSTLAEATRTIELDAGEWLVREGDPPGSAYLLRSGRLEVVQGERLVRTLTPGAVVGELSLLTGEPRSAGVRARRDATLVEVPRAAFDGLLDRDPRATRTVLSQVAGQMRTAGGRAPAERAARPHVIAVVGLHAGSGRRGRRAPPREAAGHPPDRRRRPGGSTPTGWPGPSRTSDRVLLVADGVAPGDDAAWRDFCLRQSDAVILVARAGSPVPDGRPRPRQPAGPGRARGGPAPGGPGGLGGRPPTPGG